MTKYFAAYVATLVVMVILDLLWLGVIAKSFYQQGIGHLMADKPNVVVAVMFYLIYAVGLVVFVVAPGAEWGRTLLMGALFGFFAYATYDLTNLAILRNWPVSVSVVDVLWGATVSAISVAAGKVALDRFSAG